MNRQLERVLERVRALPDDRQSDVVEVLLAFLDQQSPGRYLSPKQIANLDANVPDDGPYATDEEVRAVFARLAP